MTWQLGVFKARPRMHSDEQQRASSRHQSSSASSRPGHGRSPPRHRRGAWTDPRGLCQFLDEDLCHRGNGVHLSWISDCGKTRGARHRTIGAISNVEYDSVKIVITDAMRTTSHIASSTPQSLGRGRASRSFGNPRPNRQCSRVFSGVRVRRTSHFCRAAHTSIAPLISWSGHEAHHRRGLRPPRADTHALPRRSDPFTRQQVRTSPPSVVSIIR